MRRWFYNEMVGPAGSLGLLLLRVVMGTAFILHGWPKVQNAMNWMGPDAGVPGYLQAFAAGAEFGGGFLLIVGLLTKVAALAIGAVMVVAITNVHLQQGHPFVGKPGGASYELAAIYLTCAVLLILTGPGRFSLDSAVFGSRPADERDLPRSRTTGPG